MLQFSLILTLVLSFSNLYATENDFNTMLMKSTYRIEGSGTAGTAFVLGKPLTNDTLLYFTLVTAAHVLDSIKGDEAILNIRVKAGNLSLPKKWPLKIRSNGKPLWTKHPTHDVAAMHVFMPDDIDIALLSAKILATDSLLESYELHPGDELLVLGFPYGFGANELNYPILRSGRIASYPLLPSTAYPTFLLDFDVFSGNSGGPVYAVESNRKLDNTMLLGSTYHFIVGLVIQELAPEERIVSLTETRSIRHKLSVAVIVKSTIISETIDLVPRPNTEGQK